MSQRMWALFNDERQLAIYGSDVSQLAVFRSEKAARDALKKCHPDEHISIGEIFIEPLFHFHEKDNQGQYVIYTGLYRHKDGSITDKPICGVCWTELPANFDWNRHEPVCRSCRVKDRAKKALWLREAAEGK